MLNPIGHQGQINGGIVQGIGYALMEELRVEDGRVTNLSLGDYKLPTTRDLPPLTTVLVQSPDGVGPYSIKAIGEVPTTPGRPGDRQRDRRRHRRAHPRPADHRRKGLPRRVNKHTNF